MNALFNPIIQYDVKELDNITTFRSSKTFNIKLTIKLFLEIFKSTFKNQGMFHKYENKFTWERKYRNISTTSPLIEYKKTVKDTQNVSVNQKIEIGTLKTANGTTENKNTFQNLQKLHYTPDYCPPSKQSFLTNCTVTPPTQSY